MNNICIRSILVKSIDTKAPLSKCSFVTHLSKSCFSSSGSDGLQNDPVVLSPSTKAQSVLKRVQEFVREYVQPKEKQYLVRMIGTDFLNIALNSNNQELI